MINPHMTAMCYDARRHNWGALITHVSGVQGDQWSLAGREPEEEYLFVYGTNLDDFNPVSQASLHLRCLSPCLGSC